MNVVSTINEISSALLIIFNVGIIARISYIFFNAISLDEPYGPQVKNHVKAAIIVNAISGMVIVLMNYYPYG